MEAVGGFEDSQRATNEDAAYLRSVYTKIDNPRVKARIARVIGNLGGDANDQWLMGLMRNNDEPVEVRTAALSRVASRKMPIADAVKCTAPSRIARCGSSSSTSRSAHRARGDR